MERTSHLGISSNTMLIHLLYATQNLEKMSAFNILLKKITGTFITYVWALSFKGTYKTRAQHQRSVDDPYLSTS